MKASFLFFGGLFTCMAACSDPSTGTKAEPTTTEAPSPAPKSDKQCYSYFSNTDTITLVVKGPDSALTGSLVFMLNGKDRNIGTLKGKMLGDTLVADYTYQSEGITSIREIAFLRKDGNMLQGVGPVQVKDNHQYFSDRSKLQFSSNMALGNQHCR
ncbi:MAG TPA: hypothetical protein PLQ32_05990 [Flavihumibacter sp.]|nr:hypothetical protein [Flavihumibacter sp.]HQD09450.1 hypothetical protein [Flavihumibacter sp.]